jgi:hypothetical protein
MRRSSVVTASLVGALALATAACGSSNPSPSASRTGGPSAATTTTTTVPPVSMPSPAGKWGTKPTVTVPSGAPPTVLEASDLITGTGAAAKEGDTVTVQYVGVLYATGKEFSASWDSNMPFSFVLNAQQVIQGWAEGVVGMKAGGRRELVIPPALAYGNTPPPNSGIPADATLVFVVDLLKIG